MSYDYRRRSTDELRQIAQKYLEKYKDHRCGQFAVDIERIQESLGFEIIYRNYLGLSSLKGYVAHDARYIVVSDLATGKQIRYTVAHELSHKILEFGLWENGGIPAGALSHELTEQQHTDIEENAWELAREMMEPVPLFTERFALHLKRAELNGAKRIPAIYSAVRDTAEDFDVLIEASSRRAKTLGLITKEEFSAAFSVTL